MNKLKLKIDQLRLPFIIAGLLIAVLVVSGLAWWSVATIQRQSAMPCTDNQRLLEQIGAQLDPSDPELMEQARATIDNDITNFDRYREDYNCIYPVVVTAIYFGDLSSASEYLQLLEQLAAEGQTLDPERFDYVVDLGALEEQIAGREDLIENYEPFGGEELLIVPADPAELPPEAR